MRLVDNSYNIFIKTGGEGGEIENKSMVINDIFGQSIRKEEKISINAKNLIKSRLIILILIMFFILITCIWLYMHFVWINFITDDGDMKTKLFIQKSKGNCTNFSR